MVVEPYGGRVELAKLEVGFMAKYLKKQPVMTMHRPSLSLIDTTQRKYTTN